MKQEGHGYLKDNQNVDIQDEEYIDLSTEEQERLIEYRNSVEAAEQAKGKRILFQRAPAETLPFIVYCLYVSGQAIISIIVLFSYQGTKWPFFILIGIAMITPLFAHPGSSLGGIFSWIQSYLPFRQDK